MQTTPSGGTIPVPHRVDVLGDMRRVAQAEGANDGRWISGYPPESVIPLNALVRTKVSDPDPDFRWLIAYVDPEGRETDAWLTEALAWRGYRMAFDWQTEDRARSALALLEPGIAEAVSEPRR